MDRSELRSRLRELSGHHMVELLTDAEANLFLQEAHQSLLALAPWSFLQDEANATVAAGATEATVPAGVQEVREVFLTGANRRRLRRRTIEQLDAQPTFRATGIPWGWAPAEDGTIRVFPAPTTQLSVTIVGWPDSPPTLGTDGSQPPYDARYHEVVAYEAARNLLVREGDDSGRAQRYEHMVAWIVSTMARRYLPDGEQPIYPPGVQTQEVAQ